MNYVKIIFHGYTLKISIEINATLIRKLSDGRVEQ